MSKIERTVGWLAEKARAGTSTPTPSAQSRSGACSLEEAFPDAVADSSGCVIIDHRVPLQSPVLQHEAATHALLSELRLVYGIGSQYTTELRQAGYASITDLRDHPRWGNASAALLSDWGTPLDPAAVYCSLERWLSSSDPLCLQSLGLLPTSGVLYFDLETLGLGGAPVFLAAVGRFIDEAFLIRQTLATSLAGEVALLERMASEIRDASALLSYNGKSFDWTVLKDRWAYYGLPFPSSPIHIDLLHHTRRALGTEVPDCHLGTIEEHVLGIGRKNDLPSADVPIHYTAFLETGDASFLVPIVNHSRQDLISLAVLLERLLQMARDA